jgi:transcriptional regulator with XRE-family HTH domain
MHMSDQSASRRVNAIFGQKLARARKSRSLTQRELANLIGVSRVTVANIEGAKQNIQLAQVYSMARALDVAPNDLFPTPSELEHLAGGAQTPEDAFKNLAKLRLRELFIGSRNDKPFGD